MSLLKYEYEKSWEESLKAAKWESIIVPTCDLVENENRMNIACKRNREIK